ncbi:hypothetical protein GIB67_006361 [Kingdonia uniflora]|uniref:Uncharacterized protein n=1 Tax=Kingdonia uniflora TaxID=39325 RepID=A0A7J7P0M4_9MAGN|nr:hypothetical protein GIB67_006361 [Kingdonia uniflora]
MVSRSSVPSWMSAAASRVDFEGNVTSMAESMFVEGRETCSSQRHRPETLDFVERACAAGGAAVLSAILVNPLDIAKTRLQAQAAGVPYSPPQQPRINGHSISFGPMFSSLKCSPSCTRAGSVGTIAVCPPDCFQYKGTLDVFSKITRQVSALVSIFKAS